MPATTTFLIPSKRRSTNGLRTSELRTFHDDIRPIQQYDHPAPRVIRRMSSLEQLSTARETLSRPDTLQDKLSREAQLLLVGIESVPSAAKQQIQDHPFSTAGKLALSIGISSVLAYKTQGRSLSLFGSKSLGLGVQYAALGAGIAGISDSVHYLKPSFDAFADAAKAEHNWQQDTNAMRNNFAPFIFDATLMSAGSIGGSFVGRQMYRNTLFEAKLPALSNNGLMPPGIHEASWKEFSSRFGYNAARKEQLFNMELLLQEMRKQKAGDRAFVGGSFVSNKEIPGDFDMTWRVSGERIGELQKSAPILVDRTLQKANLGGELMATYPNSPGDGVLGFLQYNHRARSKVGVVEINVDTLPSNFSFMLRRTMRSFYKPS